MPFQISCAVPGCAASVIGQCRGYQTGCGRFYCENHSVGGLCEECARLKKADEIESDYFDTARGFKKRIGQAVLSEHRVGVILLVALGIVAFAVVYATTNDALLSLTALYACLILLGIFQWSWRKPIEARLLCETEQKRPHFTEYYRKWQKKENKEQLKKTLLLAGGILLAAAAATGEAVLSDSEREGRIREVEEGVRRALR